MNAIYGNLKKLQENQKLGIWKLLGSERRKIWWSLLQSLDSILLFNLDPLWEFSKNLMSLLSGAGKIFTCISLLCLIEFFAAVGGWGGIIDGVGL